MSYYYSATINNTNFEAAVEQVTEALSAEGFGVISTIDVSTTLKKKIDVDFKKYTILGACNPKFAHHALENEDKIGVFLPCNVVVIEQAPGQIEVAAVDPVASMLATENTVLSEMSAEVGDKLKRVIESV